MRLFTRLSFLFSLLICLLTATATHGQNRSDNNEQEPLIYYGGGFLLGFSGNSFNTQFQFGLAPFVGYKLTDRVSIGPRISGTWSIFTSRLGNGGKETAHLFSYGVGAFGRYKITDVIFAHVEYENANQPRVITGVDGLITTRFTNDNVYIGGGYLTGAGPNQFELVALYNVNQNSFGFESPFSFRLGFIRNF